MTESQPPHVVVVLVHILGLMGMAGVWLVPARLWEIVIARRIGPFPLVNRLPHLALMGSVLTTIAFAALIAADSFPRVFRCLWIEKWCTATKGGALVALALFGGAVIVVELVRATAHRLIARLERGGILRDARYAASPQPEGITYRARKGVDGSRPKD